MAITPVEVTHTHTPALSHRHAPSHPHTHARKKDNNICSRVERKRVGEVSEWHECKRESNRS